MRNTADLGVTSQINEQQVKQTEDIMKKTNKLNCKLGTCHLPNYYSHVYQQYVINPMLMYPLD